MSLMSVTRYECFTTGRVSPIMSVSWNAPRPIMAWGTWPVMATSGQESM
jgi:hypothetical protein